MHASDHDSPIDCWRANGGRTDGNIVTERKVKKNELSDALPLTGCLGSSVGYIEPCEFVDFLSALPQSYLYGKNQCPKHSPDMKHPDWRPPRLNTDRLTLRPFTEADASPLFQYASNPNIARFTLWDAHRSIDETMAFVNDYAMLRYREGLADPYAITLSPDPKPIGSCGCFWISQPNQTMELGYWVAEPFWGMGIAVEACSALIEHVFREYGLKRLQARVIEGNRSSSRVLAKLGFHYEGTLRSALYRREKFEDVLMYSLLREERRQE